MKKRIFSALLCFCLLVGLLPTAAFAEGTDEGAGTDTGKAIQIGVSQIEGAQVSSIYFGTYPQSSDGRGGYRTDPIKWRVLSKADGKPFLLSDQNLDRRQYNTTNFRVLTWEKSTIRSWLNGYGSNENSAKEDYSTNSFMNTAFSSGEQGAIAQTYVYNKTRSDGSTSPNPQHNPEGGNNTTDKVFLLSLEEVENSSYFPNGSSNRSSANTAYADYPGIRKIWWLRTPGAANITSGGGYEDVTYAAYVYTSSGNIDYDSRYGEEVHRTAFIRPAFNLDPNDVLFTSAAVGGKADAEVDGDLTAVGTAGTEWKLTLKDDSRSSFEATTETTTIEAGQSLSIRYSGARTGIDEYVSVLLCDSSDNVLYYGRIARNSASGAANITIPHALVTDSYTLKVFSEQYNGNKMTDYASAFVNLPLAVTHTHQYGAGWETDEDKHWHECSCGARNGEADHAYDNEQDASCNICGYVRAFYTLTVDLKGGSGSTASGKYAKGTVIHIDAGTRADYRFTGWISSDGGSLPTFPAQVPPLPCPPPIPRSRHTGSIPAARARQFKLTRAGSPAMTVRMDMTISTSATGRPKTATQLPARSNGGYWTTRPTQGAPGCSCCPMRCLEQAQTAACIFSSPRIMIILAAHGIKAANLRITTTQIAGS